jgi:hypothetical protein
MFALLIATILSTSLDSKKLSLKKEYYMGPKEGEEPDPDTEKCYQAYVALKNALSVAAGPSNPTNAPSPTQDTSPTQAQSPTENQNPTSEAETSSEGRKLKDKLLSNLPAEPYPDFATQCPATLKKEGCDAAYQAVAAIKVANQGLIDNFVAKCQVADPNPQNNFGHFGFKLDSILLMLIITLTGFCFNK